MLKRSTHGDGREDICMPWEWLYFSLESLLSILFFISKTSGSTPPGSVLPSAIWISPTRSKCPMFTANSPTAWVHISEHIRTADQILGCGAEASEGCHLEWLRQFLLGGLTQRYMFSHRNHGTVFIRHTDPQIWRAEQVWLQLPPYHSYLRFLWRQIGLV